MFTPSQVVRMVASMATAFDGLAVEIAQVAGASPEQTAKIKEIAEDLHEAATDLARADDAAEAGSVIDRVAADVNAVLALPNTLPLPPRAAATLRIAAMTLPVLMMAASMVWPKA